MTRVPDLVDAVWRKSSYSDGGADNCIEVGAAWRKSSYSDGGEDNCIEVGDDLPDTIPVRDSKNPAGPILLFPAAAWSTFIDTVKSGGHAGRA